MFQHQGGGYIKLKFPIDHPSKTDTQPKIDWSGCEMSIDNAIPGGDTYLDRLSKDIKPFVYNGSGIKVEYTYSKLGTKKAGVTVPYRYHV